MLMESFQDRHDLFSLTQTIYKGFMVRFDPQTFPVVPGGVTKNKASKKKLFDSLMCACVRRRHIIHQGWKQHVGSLGRSDEAKEIAKRISSWLYSFMKSIETLDEYKALFSSHIVNYCENRVLPNMSGHFPHDLHHVQLKLGILSHRSKNRTSDSTAWKLALATEADSQYSRRIPYGMIVDQVKIPGLAFNRHR
ncbi:hypothetical protein IV203_024935 [Nitzschia inconspicua]|uniref:Uncharacterized protein n=2 Tax=Nitzschia inconspicua TaxID=303405 RepID=A0A9K3KB10_9STRA|nr:hypothetical protein IV203_024935 [Nitzschia inconspicua]